VEINISMPEEITWRDSQKAEDYIHITDSKGLIKSKSSVTYLLRKRVIRKS